MFTKIASRQKYSFESQLVERRSDLTKVGKVGRAGVVAVAQIPPIAR
jgi:hypothetical protein